MNQGIYRLQKRSNLPDVIFVLLVTNGLLFALLFLGFERMGNALALWPLDHPRFGPWQLVTYAFLHAGIWHLFFNMLGLWMFGRDIENDMGSRRFAVYYTVCVVGAGIVQLVVAKVTGNTYVTVGASGGVFGVLLAYGMSYPNRTVMLIIPPIPMPAKYFVILFGLASLYLGVSGNVPGVAHFGHLGGMLFGFGLLMFWRNQRR